jgi:hypothetical protein
MDQYLGTEIVQLRYRGRTPYEGTGPIDFEGIGLGQKASGPGCDGGHCELADEFSQNWCSHPYGKGVGVEYDGFLPLRRLRMSRLAAKDWIRTVRTEA